MNSIPSILDVRRTSYASDLAICTVDGAAISYEVVSDLVTGIAADLRERGITRSDRVAVVAASGPTMAVAFLAVCSAAACAPLNPAYRQSDFEFYLGDLRPAAILVDEDSESPAIRVAESMGIPVFRLTGNPGNGELRIAGDDLGEAKRALDDGRGGIEDEVALLLHTSGTTSRPKIVPLTHRNLCLSAAQIASTLRLSSSDRCLNVMPLFHIHGLVGGMLSTLVSGGSVVCCPAFQAGRFLDWAVETSPTWYTAVPTIHQSALEEARADSERAKDVRFRFIRSSSSSLAPTLMEAMELQWGAPVIESYGMTEASHQMASNPLPPGKRKPGSVGLAAGPEVKIVDERGRFLNDGERGEVAIRGRSVTTGYLANDAANEKAFFDGWFRTGDEGYLDAEGYLFLTGRLKEMINRGGESIAPREIDEALLRHPDVVQAVAFGVPHETLGEEIVAAVVAAPNRRPSEVELRHFVAREIAEFKVPSRILFLDSIPKGPTGKIQRIGLHERLKDSLHTRYEVPATEEERWVADAFASVLRCSDVGRNDNFFALGGDSIRAVRVMIELSTKVGRDLPVSRLFEYPTPALLGEVLRKMVEAEAELDEIVRALAGAPPELVDALLRGEQSNGDDRDLSRG